MYEFHYKYIKRKYSANLLFTGAGSSVYENKTYDVYEGVYEDTNLFDFSDYPQNSIELHSKIFNLANRKVIGKMKDEFKRKIVSLLD